MSGVLFPTRTSSARCGRLCPQRRTRKGTLARATSVGSPHTAFEILSTAKYETGPVWRRTLDTKDPIATQHHGGVQVFVGEAFTGSSTSALSRDLTHHWSPEASIPACHC